MKILCICPIGIGNYLMCYPAWVLLKKEMPDAELHLLALRKPIVDLAASDKLWSGIHFIEPTKKPGPRMMAKFIMQLAAGRFYASIAFFPANTWQYNLLPFLAGIPKRFAFCYRHKQFASLSCLANNRIPVDVMLHDVQQNRAIAALVYGKESGDKTCIFPDLAVDNEMLPYETLMPGGAVFAIHPGSSAEHGMDAKRWAPEKFGKLADRIAKELNATALIVGGPDETTLKQATASAMAMPYRIIDPLPLSHTAALLRKCCCCLCNDSGIMHLAACGGTPVIALFGPTDERRNGPYGNNHCVLRKQFPGFPLWTAANVGVRRVPHTIDPNQPLRDLTVDEAWDRCASFVRNLALNICSKC